LKAIKHSIKQLKGAGYPKMSLRVSAGLLKTRGGVGYLKAMFSAKVLIEGLGLAGHVTILG